MYSFGWYCTFFMFSWFFQEYDYAIKPVFEFCKQIIVQLYLKLCAPQNDIKIKHKKIPC